MSTERISRSPVSRFCLNKDEDLVPKDSKMAGALEMKMAYSPFSLKATEGMRLNPVWSGSGLPVSLWVSKVYSLVVVSNPMRS